MGNVKILFYALRPPGCCPCFARFDRDTFAHAWATTLQKQICPKSGYPMPSRHQLLNLPPGLLRPLLHPPLPAITQSLTPHRSINKASGCTCSPCNASSMQPLQYIHYAAPAQSDQSATCTRYNNSLKSNTK
jgi:hypothetical protein